MPYIPPDFLDNTAGRILADGVLTAREILEQGLRAPDFLALSACQTGMAGTLGGDEMAGLSQALLYAGARSLLVSLWAVNDPATAHLMTGFYRGWRQQGLDKATALREAMEATRIARPAWAHTYYWGAFTLVGDWR
jgi:CHAT domain-containing protein